MDVDIHLVGDNLRDVEQHAHTVDALDADGRIEEELFVHIPFGIEDTIAEAGFQFGSYRTGTLVNLYLMAPVDKAQHIVAWDGVTTVFEFVLRNIVVSNEDGLLTVELLGYHKELRLFGGTFLLFLVATQEWHQPAPAFLASLLALQLVEVLLTEQDGLVA